MAVQEGPRTCQEPKMARGGWGRLSCRESVLKGSAKHLGFCQMGVTENWKGKKNAIIFQKAEVGFWKI